MNPDTPPFAAALIAGGRSTRMGRDKARLDWHGTPLWRHQLAKLAALEPDALLISCRSAGDFPDAGPAVHLVPDAWADAGPLGGIVSCFEAVRADYLIVLGVDLPLLPVELLRRMRQACRGCAAGTAVRREEAPGRSLWEPLAAVYPRALLPAWRAALDDGRRACQPQLRDAAAAGLLRPWPEPVPAEWFANANSPADWDALCAIGGAEKSLPPVE